MKFQVGGGALAYAYAPSEENKKGVRIFYARFLAFSNEISTVQKIVLSSGRGQANFRGLEASRPRLRTSKCVLEDVLKAKDVLEDSTSAVQSVFCLQNNLLPNLFNLKLAHNFSGVARGGEPTQVSPFWGDTILLLYFCSHHLFGPKTHSISGEDLFFGLHFWTENPLYFRQRLFFFVFTTFRHNFQRWSRGHKARDQGHKNNPRPRAALPRTDPLEAKDRNARGQGQGRRTQAQVFSERKGL